MSDWDLPELASGYANFLLYLAERDFDAISLGYDTITNPITGMMRYVRADNKFQEYNGTIWVDKALAVAGGGTGGATAADARTNLGLGGMATQAANSVAITGGSIAGLGSLGVNGNATIVGQLTTGAGSVVLTNAAGKIPAITSGYFASLDAAALTNIPAANLTGAYAALSGALITNLNGSAIASGTVPVARLGSGSVGAGLKVLLDNGTWGDYNMFLAGMQGSVSFGSTEVSHTSSLASISAASVNEVLPQFHGPFEIYDSVGMTWAVSMQVTAAGTVTFYRTAASDAAQRAHDPANLPASTHYFSAFRIRL